MWFHIIRPKAHTTAVTSRITRSTEVLCTAPAPALMRKYSVLPSVTPSRLPHMELRDPISESDVQSQKLSSPVVCQKRLFLDELSTKLHIGPKTASDVLPTETASKDPNQSVPASPIISSPLSSSIYDESSNRAHLRLNVGRQFNRRAPDTRTLFISSDSPDPLCEAFFERKSDGIDMAANTIVRNDATLTVDSKIGPTLIESFSTDLTTAPSPTNESTSSPACVSPLDQKSPCSPDRSTTSTDLPVSHSEKSPLSSSSPVPLTCSSPSIVEASGIETMTATDLSEKHKETGDNHLSTSPNSTTTSRFQAAGGIAVLPTASRIPQLKLRRVEPKLRTPQKTGEEQPDLTSLKNRASVFGAVLHPPKTTSNNTHPSNTTSI